MGPYDIHLKTLRDLSQFSDDGEFTEEMGISTALWPLFGIVWKSSEILAHLMLDVEIGGKSFLEVGCGMALPSHILNKRNANITATDYNPDVELFLDENTKLNENKLIPFYQSDWREKHNLEIGKFDCVLGSDLLYQQHYEKLLAVFIDEHAKKNSKVFIVDPGRGKQNRFKDQMKNFRYTCEVITPEQVSVLYAGQKGCVQVYER